MSARSILKKINDVVTLGTFCYRDQSFIKTPHAHLQYVHNRYAMFQKDPLKTGGDVDYTNAIP